MYHKALHKIFLMSALLLCSLGAFAQTRVVSGQVFDAAKQPLMGITVMSSPSNGVVTDMNGAFSLTVPSEAVTLEFVCLGYSTVRQTVQPAQDNITVYMTEDAMNLQETVVVGYGVQKKVNLTGAVSTVTSKELDNRTSPTLTHMLQGSVPGMFVSTSNGSPDDVASINIRGYNSINGGSPLVLIDGVEGDLTRVDPNQIESVSILKDGSGSIYGARAGNGVILVTTKTGTNQAPTISVNSSVSLQGNTVTTRPANSFQRALFQNDIYMNGGGVEDCRPSCTACSFRH